MDGWVNGLMDGWVNGLMDGWVNGLMAFMEWLLASELMIVMHGLL